MAQAPRRQRRAGARPRGHPRWQRRKDDRPGEIVAAALEVFAERGFAATNLDEVARRAGVTKGTIYLYFKSKEALFQAVVRETIIPNIARAEQDVAAFQGSAADLLSQMLHTYWRVMGETKLSAIPKLVISEATSFPELARFYHTEVVSRAYRLVAGVLERGIARGEFRRVDVSAATRLAVAPIVLALVNKHSVYSCVPEAGKAFDACQYLETHVDLFLRGLRKQPAPEA